jgi:hypothetical protein
LVIVMHEQADDPGEMIARLVTDFLYPFGLRSPPVRK